MGVELPAKTRKAAKPSVLCCHLANTNEELHGLATAIPPFAKLLDAEAEPSTVRVQGLTSDQ